ncbi:MAG: tRNA pseudouridine(55) synthase TruB [Burkholderiales bacterium]
MTGSGRTRNAVDGVLLLNKPRGLSSQQAVSQVKRLFAARKAGHTGTLDPMADGLLPVGLGEATKFTQYVLDADKCYLATLGLGVTTSSGDAEGEIIAQHPVAVSVAAVAGVLRRFTGEQVQTPPMYSAVKIDGKPLYAYARAGIQVERKSRVVSINELQLIDFIDKKLILRVACSKGTYIRVLAEDIGAALGCGAHLTALTRESAGPFRLAEASSLAELEAMDMTGRMARLLPPETFASSLPRHDLDAGTQQQLGCGQTIAATGVAPGLYRLYGVAGEFVGVGEVADSMLRPRRLVALSTGLPDSPINLSNPAVTG